jgi:hypothetical protein
MPSRPPERFLRERQPALAGMEEDATEVLKLFDTKDAKLDWDFDGEADTRYLRFGKPRPATGVDIGQGVVVRSDEALKEVVGLTIVGVERQLEDDVRKCA